MYILINCYLKGDYFKLFKENYVGEIVIGDKNF